MLLIVCACAHVPTDVEQQKECQRQLDGGVSVNYRKLHPQCGQIESVRFPITDENTFREAFPCAEAVDFSKERVDVISFWESMGNDIRTLRRSRRCAARSVAARSATYRRPNPRAGRWTSSDT